MKILAIGAHPVDVELSCFGTLALCVKRGDSVVVCSVTNGNLGHKKLDKERLALIRMVEGAEASQVIKASFCTLEIDDMSVDEKDEEQIRKMTNIILSVKPDLIITHGEGEDHSDHIATSKLVFKASHLATLPNYIASDLPIPAIPVIYYMESVHGSSFHGDTYVDVSDTFDLKMKAIGCHTSQLEGIKEDSFSDLFSIAQAIGSYRGLQCNKRVAEVFMSCDKKVALTTRILP